MAIGTTAAIIGAGVLAGGASLYGSKKAASATSQAAGQAADAQVQAAQTAADLQREMFYKSLSLQAPQRYAGNMALESLLREAYGENFKLPDGFNQYDQSGGVRSVGGATRSTRPVSGATTRYVPGGTNALGGTVGRLAGALTGTGDLIRSYQDSVATARPMVIDPFRTGSSYVDGQGGSVLAARRSAAQAGHAPPIDTGTSALYKLQQEEGTKAITAALAARGLNISGPGVEHLSEFYRKLSATEAARKQALLESIAGYGNQASGAGANAALSLGGQLSSIYSGMGDSRAQALIAAGNARAGNYANTANTVGQFANLGAQLYGMYGGGGGGGFNPYINPMAGGYAWNT